MWKQDPVRAERDLVPTVGISDITHDKHLTWLSALFKFADANGYVTPDVDLGKLRRKVKKKKGGKRLPWAEADLRTLVSGPVWTGCKGLWNRLAPGDVVFHDGVYWGLPLVVCTGGRSEEQGFAATGSGSVFARGSIKKLYREDLSEQEAATLVVQALYDAADDDTATGGPDIARRIYPIITVITEEGFRKLTEAEAAEIARTVLDRRLEEPNGPRAAIV